MPEAVECSECGASYDSEQHPFCPRCGSTARGAALPGAVASAARRSPGRRRVQASGVVLLAIGLLFLVSSAASFLIPSEEAAEPLVDLMETQPGGAVVVRFPPPGDGNANATVPTNATVRLLTLDGDEVANATVATGGEARLAMDGASARLLARQGDVEWNRTILALRGDTVTLDLPEGGGGDGSVALSQGVKAATDVARYMLLAMALLLVVGGLCALTLRFFPLAAAGAATGALFGLVALVGFLAAGLLFALPFGFCAFFILRGRRHFRRRDPAPPPGPPSPGQPPR